ncbi:hypothetical protein SCLARK_00581 [Spiroplasma clarkii]|uniref:UPF0122 protein SCLAR_v1c03620 n=1 Tax=Spiroplasma clarkii TaxID=2139 RepID=A0A1Y0KZT9_9MOLU|nr:sigma factor-like helix-turn-helix DNA-binding protein [Spiroplasma clarkii]ARU91256.1 hypothetical protein SCLARK_00581 [Spiroplasma clarkii]ATX70692.1 hypothetical protein SCLAR_v1c03620 [Spiroplasma clarkii]
MMMNSVEKSVEIAQLYDYYKMLLTDKQKEYFELYFFEDLTYQEIGEAFGVSKTAIHDSISKTITILRETEQKLNLKTKSDLLKTSLEQYKSQKISLNELLVVLEREI